jgi:hypothetical protein
MQQFSRFRGEADIQQAALTTGPDCFAEAMQQPWSWAKLR